MKKLLALLMALCLALTMFAGCASEEETKKEETKKDPEAAAIETCLLEEAQAQLSKRGVTIPTAEMFMNQTGVPAEMQDELLPTFEKLVAKVSFRVENIKVDGDKATADLVLTVPDTTQSLDPDSLVSDEEAASIVQNASTKEEAQLELCKVLFERMADEMITVDETVSFELEKVDGQWKIVE